MKKMMIGLLLALSSLSFSEEEINVDKNLKKYATRIEVNNSIVEMIYGSNIIKIKETTLSKLDRFVEDYNPYRLTKAFHFLVDGLSNPENIYYIIEGDYYENNPTKNKNKQNIFL